MKVVLIEPEIPQNTGNIARLCACTGVELILVGKLGFSLEDKYLKRAGLDYWQYVKIKIINTIDLFFEKYSSKCYRHAFISTKGEKIYNMIDTNKIKNLLLIFGNETSGLPSYIYKNYCDKLYRIPIADYSRSLNLSNAAATVTYFILEKNSFQHLS